jgi:hypothetical protein
MWGVRVRNAGSDFPGIHLSLHVPLRDGKKLRRWDGHGWTHGPSERQHDCAGGSGLVDPGGVGGHNNQIRPMFHPCHLGLIMNIVRSIKEELSY